MTLELTNAQINLVIDALNDYDADTDLPFDVIKEHYKTVEQTRKTIEKQLFETLAHNRARAQRALI